MPRPGASPPFTRVGFPPIGCAGSPRCQSPTGPPGAPRRRHEQRFGRPSPVSRPRGRRSRGPTPIDLIVTLSITYRRSGRCQQGHGGLDAFTWSRQAARRYHAAARHRVPSRPRHVGAGAAGRRRRRRTAAPERAARHARAAVAGPAPATAARPGTGFEAFTGPTPRPLSGVSPTDRPSAHRAVGRICRTASKWPVTQLPSIDPPVWPRAKDTPTPTRRRARFTPGAIRPPGRRRKNHRHPSGETARGATRMLFPCRDSTDQNRIPSPNTVPAGCRRIGGDGGMETGG